MGMELQVGQRILVFHGTVGHANTSCYLINVFITQITDQSKYYEQTQLTRINVIQNIAHAGKHNYTHSQKHTKLL